LQNILGSRQLRRSFSVAAACAAMALAIPAEATARSWHLSSPLPWVAPALFPPPTNCPEVNPRLVHQRRNTQPNSVPPIITWVQGGALAGFTAWELQNHRLTLAFGPRTEYGYPQKIFWQRTAGAPAVVRLSGWNLRTMQRVWFGIPLPDAHPELGAPPPVIAWPSGLVRNHFVHNASAPTFTFVPAAGCYVIKAQWKGGSWTVPFAAGG
jgi:hypothetical protein